MNDQGTVKVACMASIKEEDMQEEKPIKKPRIHQNIVCSNHPQTLIFQAPNCISSLEFNPVAADNFTRRSEALKTTILQHPFPQTTFAGLCYYCAGSYNGVVCIHLTTLDLQQQIYLWNPFTQECRPIPLPPIFEDDRPHDVASHYQKRYWFGYVDSLKDVIIFHLKRKQSFVYSMSTNRWRESRYSVQFEIGSEPMPGRCSGTRFVLKNGALYYDLGLDSLLKFDLLNGTFARIEPFIQHLNGHSINYEETYRIVGSVLGVTQDNILCSGRILEKLDNHEWIVEIWVRVEGRNEDTGYWKSVCRTSLGKETPGSYPWVFGFTYDGKMFVGGTKLLIVDPKQSSGVNVQRVETMYTAMYTVSYVETLVSPYNLLPNWRSSIFEEDTTPYFTVKL